MTEKELKAERDRLVEVVAKEEATAADAIRLAEIRVTLRIIQNVRYNNPPWP